MQYLNKENLDEYCTYKILKPLFPHLTFRLDSFHQFIYIEYKWTEQQVLVQTQKLIFDNFFLHFTHSLEKYKMI